MRHDSSDISLIVPVGGAAPHWERCLESLSRLDPSPVEIIAVIDGPKEDLAAKAEALGVRVVRLGERGGPARARNRGAQTATGDILLFIDSDIEVPSDLAARVAALFADDQAPAAVIGSYDTRPGDAGFLSQYRNLLHHFVHQQGREQASTFWAGCGAVRRQAFENVDGFDERYGDPSMEDIELGSRLVQAGHSIRLVKDLQVKHLKRWRLLDMFATDLLRRAMPWTELMLRQGRLINDLNVKNRDRVSVAAAFVLLGSLLTAWLWPPSLAVGAVAAILMLALNASFFAFLWRQRGGLFAIATVPVYWGYLLTCGLGAALGLLRYLFLRSP